MSIDYSSQDVVSRINQGDMAFELGNYDAASKAYQGILCLFKTLDVEQKTDCYIRLGRIAKCECKYDVASENFAKALLIRANTNSEDQKTASMNYEIGELYLQQTMYVHAQSFFRTSLRVLQKLVVPQDALEASKREIEWVGTLLKITEKALEAKASSSFFDIGSVSQESSSSSEDCSEDDAAKNYLVNGDSSFASKNYEEALKAYQHSFGLFEDLGQGISIEAAHCQIGMGKVFLSQGRKADAVTMFEGALGIVASLESPDAKLVAQLNDLLQTL